MLLREGVRLLGGNQVRDCQRTENFACRGCNEDGGHLTFWSSHMLEKIGTHKALFLSSPHFGKSICSSTVVCRLLYHGFGLK